MFAYPADGVRVLHRGDVCRIGLRTGAEPYLGDGTHFLLSSVEPGTYTVGIRYPDAVVRATTIVEVGSGLTEVRLELEAPLPEERLALEWQGATERQLRPAGHPDPRQPPAERLQPRAAELVVGPSDGEHSQCPCGAGRGQRACAVRGPRVRRKAPMARQHTGPGA